jgi:hypothetical protein
MLCPNLATQGQFIGESTEGLAFAFQDDRREYKNIGANAKPLQIFVYTDCEQFMTLTLILGIESFDEAINL